MTLGRESDTKEQDLSCFHYLIQQSIIFFLSVTANGGIGGYEYKRDHANHNNESLQHCVY